MSVIVFAVAPKIILYVESATFLIDEFVPCCALTIVFVSPVPGGPVTLTISVVILCPLAGFGYNVSSYHTRSYAPSTTGSGSKSPCPELSIIEIALAS